MKTTTNLLLALAMMAGGMVSDALAVTNNAATCNLSDVQAIFTAVQGFITTSNLY